MATLKNAKIEFQAQYSLNAGQKYRSILQYFRPALSYHLTLRSLYIYLWVAPKESKYLYVRTKIESGQLAAKGTVC